MSVIRRRHCEVSPSVIKTDETDLLDPSDDEDDDENSEDLIKTGWKLYEKIFSFLDVESLLEARQVCKRWNQIVCRDSLLFSKIRVKIQSDDNCHHLSSRSPRTPFTYSFNCPNFNFDSYDFRCETVQDFFSIRGNIIKHLKLTNCLITLPRLQGIMIGCAYVEHFELDGVHRALATCERIFPKPYQFRCFPNLKTLILTSAEPPINDGTKLQQRQIRNSNAPDNEVNLMPGFLQDLIEYSENLHCVHLHNWSGKTSSYFMNIVNQRARYRQLKEFHASGIRPPLTSVDLIPLCVRTAHIGLKKLTLSPASPFQHHGFGSMVIRGILRNYRSTLEYLNVTNCPVNSTVFKSSMPKLRVLIAIGTNISSIALFSTLIPNLQKAVFQNTVQTPRQIIQRYLTRYNLSPPFLPSMAIESYIANRLGFCRGHYLINPTGKKSEPDSRRKSVINKFYACSTFDFVSLVLFGMSFIALIIFGLSTVFKSHSAIIFISFVLLIFFWELYEILTKKK